MSIINNLDKSLCQRITLLFLIVILGIALPSFAFHGTPTDTPYTDDGAKIGLYCYPRTRGEPKGEPVILVHGYASNGEIWYKGPNIVEKLRAEGYDVIIVDTRRNVEDEADLGPKGWRNLGFKEYGLDVAKTISEGKRWFNDKERFPPPNDRNYDSVKVITHSNGFRYVSEHTKSSYYQNDISEIISINPNVNGTTNLIAVAKNLDKVLLADPFSFSLATYEAAIELIEGKLWIPGKGFVSSLETLQSMPFSTYTRDNSSWGPDENIPICIGVARQDKVIGFLNQLLWRRPELNIYEYFDVGHSGYMKKLEV